MFQLKFNEEANSLLRFGLRAYFKNEISFYRYQDSAKIEYDDDEEEYITHYRKSDKVLVNSCENKKKSVDKESMKTRRNQSIRKV